MYNTHKLYLSNDDKFMLYQKGVEMHLSGLGHMAMSSAL